MLLSPLLVAILVQGKANEFQVEMVAMSVEIRGTVTLADTLHALHYSKLFLHDVWKPSDLRVSPEERISLVRPETVNLAGRGGAGTLPWFLIMLDWG